MLLTFRAKTTVPYTTSTEIVKLVKGLVNKILIDVTGLLQQRFSEISDPALIMSTVESNLENIKNIFAKFRSEHKIQKHYECHPLFIVPKSVPVGKRVEYQKTLFGTTITETVSTVKVVSITETC